MMPSTLRLSEYAKRFTYPEGIQRTVWPRVEAKGAELGLGFDWWQSQLGRVCLGYGPNGRYVATVGGIGMSIPRQVGKTYFVLAMLVIMCILFPGLQVVWTAHHLRTSTKTFTSLRGICRRKKVAPHVRAMRAANGEQQVEFVNGSMIMFGARSQGFGRGFDEIDVEVFDEAQILDTKALEDMIAATNQARHKHGALLFFMGTPPRPTDPSEAFRRRRDESWLDEASDAVWLELSADPDSLPDDESQWPVMNPSYPLRTPHESMQRLRKNLKDDDSWNREGRGIWDAETTAAKGLPVDEWIDLADPSAERGTDQSFGLATAPDRSWSAIAVAWRRPDGAVQTMLVDYQRDTSWVAARADELLSTWGGRFLTDVPSRGLVAGAEEPPPADQARADNEFSDRIVAGTVHHGNQPAMNVAVRGAQWRTSGETRVLDRKGAVDISPVRAAALAVHGLQTAPSASGWMLSF